MKKRRNIILTITAAICLSLSACAGQEYEVVYLENNGNNCIASETASTETSGAEASTVPDYEGYKDITLNDGETSVCDGAELEGNTLTITKSGKYRISGSLKNGQIIVDAKGEEISILLDNAEIENNGGSALYIKKADKVFIALAENSVNKIVSTGAFPDDEKADGAVFSKSDITFSGNGKLIVESSSHALVGKDDLVILGGNYEITAEKKGISADESIDISGCNIGITSKSHGICSKNDSDEKGNIVISGGCSIYIKTENDGIHASGITDIQSGTITISAGDDGIHSDTSTNVSGGGITITGSKEGIEGHTVTISGGVIDITSSDDGINAAGGSNEDGNQNGWGRKGGFDVDESAVISISGGEITVNANGDGIDSNGRLLISGGVVYVSGPTNSGDGALDSGSEATITGGTVIAAGSKGMAVNFGENSSQGSILCNFDSAVPENTAVLLKDKDGNVLAEYVPVKKYECIVISTPDIKKGETYTIEAGNETKVIEMTKLIYGDSFGFGGGFGNGNADGNGFGGFPREDRGEMPEKPNRDNRRPMDENGFGERPALPDTAEQNNV